MQQNGSVMCHSSDEVRLQCLSTTWDQVRTYLKIPIDDNKCIKLIESELVKTRSFKKKKKVLIIVNWCSFRNWSRGLCATWKLFLPVLFFVPVVIYLCLTYISVGNPKRIRE